MIEEIELTSSIAASLVVGGCDFLFINHVRCV